MNQNSESSGKVTGNVILLLLVVVVVAVVGFIFTWGKAILELVYVLRDYVKALTEAIQIQPEGAQNESFYGYYGNMFSFGSGSA